MRTRIIHRASFFQLGLTVDDGMQTGDCLETGGSAVPGTAFGQCFPLNEKAMKYPRIVRGQLECVAQSHEVLWRESAAS